MSDYSDLEYAMANDQEAVCELTDLVAEQEETISSLREQVKVLRESLGLAKRFIKNGIDLGYITPPEPGDVAYDTLPTICKALEQAKPEEGE